MGTWSLINESFYSNSDCIGDSQIVNNPDDLIFSFTEDSIAHYIIIIFDEETQNQLGINACYQFLYDADISYVENQHTNASFGILNYSEYQNYSYPYKLTNDNTLKMWRRDFYDNACIISEFVAIEEFPDTTLCNTYDLTND